MPTVEQADQQYARTAKGAKAPGKTREQVRAELEQARKDGTIKAWSAGYIEPIKVSKTRAQVVAETLAAIRGGEVAAIDSEAYAFNQGAGQPTGVRLAQSAK